MLAHYSVTNKGDHLTDKVFKKFVLINCRGQTK